MMDLRAARQFDDAKNGDQREQFQRDRDRILYSDYFRRLANVTQVASANEGHIFHNRLTHSLKVAQLCRRLAEKFQKEQKARCEELGGIDPDVLEAAGLAHDIGHPPFGHIGEYELDSLARDKGATEGFEGNAQTFRILTRLAPHRATHQGLNLTRATLNAILKYPWRRELADPTSKKSKKFSYYQPDTAAFAFARNGDVNSTEKCPEAQIMDFADSLAYSVHDLADFYQAGLIPLESLARDQSVMDEFLRHWSSEGEKEKGLAETVRSTIRHYEGLLQSLTATGQRGTYKHAAQFQTQISQVIQRYVQSVSLAAASGPNGILEIKDSSVADVEMKFLQRIVWHYVIKQPGLGTQQYGQRHIIQCIFEVYHVAVVAAEKRIVPPRFWDALDLTTAGHVQTHEDARTRLVVDIVASLSESEAIAVFRRVRGVSAGSIVDLQPR